MRDDHNSGQGNIPTIINGGCNSMSGSMHTDLLPWPCQDNQSLLFSLAFQTVQKLVIIREIRVVISNDNAHLGHPYPHNVHLSLHRHLCRNCELSSKICLIATRCCTYIKVTPPVSDLGHPA